MAVVVEVGKGWCHIARQHIEKLIVKWPEKVIGDFFRDNNARRVSLGGFSKIMSQRVTDDAPKLTKFEITFLLFVSKSTKRRR